jgi:hypothetical protein
MYTPILGELLEKLSGYSGNTDAFNGELLLMDSRKTFLVSLKASRGSLSASLIKAIEL